jgi:hypothetical protein
MNAASENLAASSILKHESITITPKVSFDEPSKDPHINNFPPSSCLKEEKYIQHNKDCSITISNVNDLQSSPFKNIIQKQLSDQLFQLMRPFLTMKHSRQTFHWNQQQTYQAVAGNGLLKI